MVVADAKASSHALGKRAEMLAYALTKWFERLEAGAMARRVDADVSIGVQHWLIRRLGAGCCHAARTRRALSRSSFARP